MRLTKEIVEAINLQVDIFGSQKAFAEAVGISPQNLCKYINGEVKTIRPKIWSKLEKFLIGTHEGCPISSSHLDAAADRLFDLNKELLLREAQKFIRRGGIHSAGQTTQFAMACGKGVCFTLYIEFESLIPKEPPSDQSDGKQSKEA